MKKTVDGNDLDARHPTILDATADTLNVSALPKVSPDLVNCRIPLEVLLTEHDLARRQNRSVKTIRNQRVLGVGVPFIKIGRLVRYRLQDVVASEYAGLRKSTSE